MQSVKMIKVKVNDQYEIILPKHRADRPEWYTEHGWERARLNSMHKHISNNDVVYYIGAEEGEMPALCQMWGAEVVLFEPNPKVWSNIKAIWEANKLETPICFEGFASNVDRLLDVQDVVIGQGFPASANKEIIAAHGFKELDKEADNYHQIKIDTVVEITSLAPTAISIDVEGSEGHVLRGAEQTLRTFKPKIWLSGHPEFMIQQYNEWLGELRGWVKDLGYKETLLSYDHEVHLFYEAVK